MTELDLQRLFPFPDDGLAIAELLPGEFQRVVAAHDVNTDPDNVSADSLWWTWARMPAGSSRVVADPETFAVNGYFVALLESWLQRELATHPTGANARRALQDEVSRWS